MGTHFDFFDDSSHWDTNLVNTQAKKNRDILLAVMEEFGFKTY